MSYRLRYTGKNSPHDKNESFCDNNNSLVVDIFLCLRTCRVTSRKADIKLRRSLSLNEELVLQSRTGLVRAVMLQCDTNRSEP